MSASCSLLVFPSQAAVSFRGVSKCEDTLSDEGSI